MNNVPESLNFSQIYHGMIGKDFITAFNGNFNICNTNLIAIIGEMIYKVKSSDIKEFKVLDGVVKYTLDEYEPKEWIPVDITEWGNIKGDINNQSDLMNLLNGKAAVDTVETLSSIVNTINSNLANLTSTVSATNVSVNDNSNKIVEINNTLLTKVNSTSIKEIRLNNSIFQWSPDGINWYQQEVADSLDWGHISGDITQQTDLYQRLSELSKSIEDLESSKDALTTSVSTLTNSLNNLTKRHEATEADVEAIDNALKDLSTLYNTLNESKANAADLATHIDNHSNPHQVTKEQIGLSKVDNTADSEKPISDLQRAYVDEAILNVNNNMDFSTIVRNRGNASGLMVTDINSYFSSAGMYANTLAIVTDKVALDNLIASFTLEGTGSSVTDETTLISISNVIEESKLKFTITNLSPNSNRYLDRISIKLNKNDGTSLLEVFEPKTSIGTSQSYSFVSSLDEANVLMLTNTNIIISYKEEAIAAPDVEEEV